LPNAYISGTGMYMPPEVVTNDDLRTRYGIETDNEWIVKRTGIEARRFAAEGVGTADLGAEAAKVAIARANLEPRDLDLILFATLSPDYCFPGSGVLAMRKLGLADGDNPRFTGAMDIRNQCSGFLYGLSTATAYVRSGMAKHVLVIGAEKHSAALDLTTRGRTVASLFGDGAGAVVVSATEEDRGVRGCWLNSDGRHAEVLYQPIWNISRRTFVKVDAEGNGYVPAEELWAHMDGKTVFKNAVERMILVLMQACWEHKLQTKDIDLFVFHQANMRINQYIQTQLGLPDEKVVHNIHKYGNTTAATIPTLLHEAELEGRLKRGMKVACVGFGSGFTWGAALIDW
jgi:3-oxoacyl-[acyl-carrier-protein] synthase-3